MLIRIDSGCQVEGSRLLLPGREITAYVYRGRDAYMHTNRITNEKKVVRITVDRSRTYTVSGTIEPDSTETTLNFKTDQGNMTITQAVELYGPDRKPSLRQPAVRMHICTRFRSNLPLIQRVLPEDSV